MAEFRAGRFAQALEHAVEGSDLAAACGRADLLAAAALAVHDVGAPELQPGLLRLCERALDAPSGAGDPALRSRLLSQAASALTDAGRPGAAAARAVEALELAERCGDPGAVVDAVRARMKAEPGRRRRRPSGCASGCWRSSTPRRPVSRWRRCGARSGGSTRGSRSATWPPSTTSWRG